MVTKKLSVAVIGSGHAGMLMAVGLIRRGHEVTVYSDRSADQILYDTAPTGTGCLFGDSITIERNLGAQGYENGYEGIQGMDLTFGPRSGIELMHFGARTGDLFGSAVDLRLKSVDRMRQLEAEGGKVLIRSVSPDDLDEIARVNDLTFVATGRAGLAHIFPRNDSRSTYTQAKRELVMLICSGIPTGPGSFPHRMADGSPIVISMFGNAGELFWVPFFHFGAGSCWCLVIEAHPGGVLDRFRGITTYDECFRVCRDVVEQWTPWDWGILKDMAPIADTHAWLKGAIIPTIREPVGFTSGGHPVMSLGDTSISIDPIAGQGANSGVRQVGAYVEEIDRHEGDFEPGWMESCFEHHWKSFGEGACRFTNLFLEPLDSTAVRVMKSCFASQASADRLFYYYSDPSAAYPSLFERADCDRWIRHTTGQRPANAVNRGLLKILKGQIRQRLRGEHFPYAALNAGAGALRPPVSP